MSRERLAEKVGVDPTTIYRWETGRAFPEGKNIEAIAQALGCTVADLYSPPSDHVKLSDLAKPADSADKILKMLDERLPPKGALAEIAQLSAELERVKAENFALKKELKEINSIHPDLPALWAQARPLDRVLALSLLSRDRKYIDQLPDEDLDAAVPFLRALGSLRRQSS